MSKIFTYNHTVYVPYSAQQVYSVVDDVAAYQQFLPNCAGSGIVNRCPNTASTERVQGYMDLAFLGLRHRLESDNLHTPCQQIDLKLLKGPFKYLTGRWLFKDLGLSPTNTTIGAIGCKVSLNLQWEYNNALLAITLGQRFESIAKQLLEAFMAETAKRASK